MFYGWVIVFVSAVAHFIALGTAFYSFGAYSDLAHNITDIVDEQGQTVVRNEYGEDPSDVSFDRVVRQEIGGGDDENVVTFKYHDLEIEGGNAPIYPPPGVQRFPGPYSQPDSRPGGIARAGPRSPDRQDVAGLDDPMALGDDPVDVPQGDGVVGRDDDRAAGPVPRDGVEQPP